MRPLAGDRRLIADAVAPRARKLSGGSCHNFCFSHAIACSLPTPCSKGSTSLLAGDPARLLRPGLAQQVQLAERQRALALPAGPTARQRQVQELGSALIPGALEAVDREGAAVGVQPSYPFLDHRLMELGLSLPLGQKLADGWDRIALRRAMQGILPARVQWRAVKARLGSNFLRQLAAVEQRRIHDVLYCRPEVIAPFVDLSLLRACHARYRRCPAPAADEVLAVYGATILGLWLRRTGLSP